VREARAHPPHTLPPPWDTLGPTARFLLVVGYYLRAYRLTAGKGDTFGLPINDQMVRLLDRRGKGVLGKAIRRLLRTAALLPVGKTHRAYYARHPRTGKLLKPCTRTFRLAPALVAALTSRTETP
jgi:hypothetical protein